MYLRYLAKYYNATTNKEGLGFFWAAEYLKNEVDLSVADRKELEAQIHFFDYNLPIPEYYQDQKNRQTAKSATSWFKDNAEDYITRMNTMAAILESYQVEVQRISSKKLPGKVIYEDDFQVTIMPHRELANKVR